MNSKESLKDIKNWVEYITRLDYVEPIVRGEVKELLYNAYHKTTPEFEIIERDLETLETINSKCFLLFNERKKLAKEYEDWCIKNNVLITDTTNMVTWFLCIKLKEWLKNDK